MNTEQTSTKKQGTVRIAKIEKASAEPVYNMEVDDNHNFAISEGVIVHNCMDATRYFVKTMGIAKNRRQYTPIWG